MKVAVLLAGNLGCHRLCIKSIMDNIIKPNNADVFILASRNNNYIHASSEHFERINVDVKVTKEDKDSIIECFGSHIKHFGYIEDIENYEEGITKNMNEIKDRISWIDKPTEPTEIYDAETKNIDYNVRYKYIDQYLRLQYLAKMANDYDYIIKARIDQICDTEIKIQDTSVEILWWNGMENLFYGSANIMKEICLTFVNKIGMYDTKDYREKYCQHSNRDYRLTSDLQFRGFIAELVPKHNVLLEPNKIRIGWRLFKSDSVCSIPNYDVKDRERMKNKVEVLNYYKFTPDNSIYRYSFFDIGNNIIWVYYMYRS